MDSIDILLILIIIGIILFLVFNLKSKTVKSSSLSKEQIMENYKNELNDILVKYEHDKDIQKEQKTIYLKNLSSKLSRNIYFNENEAKQFIKELATI